MHLVIFFHLVINFENTFPILFFPCVKVVIHDSDGSFLISKAKLLSFKERGDEIMDPIVRRDLGTSIWY